MPPTSSVPAYAVAPAHYQTLAYATEHVVNSDLPAAAIHKAAKAAALTKRTFSSTSLPLIRQAPSLLADAQQCLAQSHQSPGNFAPLSINIPNLFSSWLFCASVHNLMSTSASTLTATPLLQLSQDPPSSPSSCSSAKSNGPLAHVGTEGSLHDVSDVDCLLDWESRNVDTPFWLHAVAGSCAGVVEHSIMYPLDTIKTRIQALNALASRELSAQGTRSATRYALKELYRESGFKGFFRGLPAICAGSIPAHAALFSVYELSKSQFDTERPLFSALCGALATVSHDFILTPTDVIKQRLQLGCYGGIFDCFNTMLKQEGWNALYRSIPTTIFMNVPFGAILVTTNETLKRLLGVNDWLKDNNVDSQALKTKGHPLPYSFLSLYFVTAGLAGGVAGALTTPLDVIKTRLQTQDVQLRKFMNGPPQSNMRAFCSFAATTKQRQRTSLNAKCCHTWRSPTLDLHSMSRPRYSNFLSTVRLIFKEEGARGFWKGTSARLALSIPSAALCWGTYESVKYIVVKNLLHTSY